MPRRSIVDIYNDMINGRIEEAPRRPRVHAGYMLEKIFLSGMFIFPLAAISCVALGLDNIFRIVIIAYGIYVVVGTGIMYYIMGLEEV